MEFVLLSGFGEFSSVLRDDFVSFIFEYLLVIYDLLHAFSLKVFNHRLELFLVFLIIVVGIFVFDHCIFSLLDEFFIFGRYLLLEKSVMVSDFFEFLLILIECFFGEVVDILVFEEGGLLLLRGVHFAKDIACRFFGKLTDGIGGFM